MTSSTATLVFVIWGFIILGIAINKISESLYWMWFDWKNKQNKD